MSGRQHSHLWPGAALALGSAVLFGLAAPVAKLLLESAGPQLLAGLLYLGAGLGLAAVHLGRLALGLPAAEAPLHRANWLRLALAILFGGIGAPLLLMLGLSRTDASSASLLLNLEGLATMAIAWVIFRENVDRRLLLGAALILGGAVALSWQGRGIVIDSGAALIAGACLCWGIDNNVTRSLSAADPVLIAMAKGIVAGAVNTGLALLRGAALPDAATGTASMLAGFLGVGLSLVLFVPALRHLGAARTSAYFSMAPFIGAVGAIVLLDEPVTTQLLIAGALMAAGLWLHLAERHAHEHQHEPLEHDHSHIHDAHHRHGHAGPVTEPHSHPHRHVRLRHVHPHHPDLHHRHDHG
jgi:drug/metabolite transporter (DMT)-like permease